MCKSLETVDSMIVGGPAGNWIECYKRSRYNSKGRAGVHEHRMQPSGCTADRAQISAKLSTVLRQEHT